MITRNHFVALVAAASLLWVGAAGAEKTSLRSTMHDVLDRLTAILPLAFGPSPLSPAERERFEVGLGELIEAAGHVEDHGVERDAGFRYLGRSLEDDLAGVRRSLERGEEDSARYFLVGATANCVACHSRLPSAAAPSLAKALEPLIASDGVSAHERAQLLVATRQFDRALEVWEEAFVDPEMTPAAICSTT